MVSEDFLFSVCLAGHLILFASLKLCAHDIPLCVKVRCVRTRGQGQAQPVRGSKQGDHKGTPLR